MIAFDGPAVLPDFLPGADFSALRQDVLNLSGAERSYVPLHKKGGTIAYSTIRRLAPGLAEFYHSRAHRQAVSEIAGVVLEPTPPSDESSLSILIYERPGDHIGWHYDHNFYRGRHFTILLAIENRGHGTDGLSASRLLVKDGDAERVISTAANTLVVFEGARVLHKVTPIEDGERRVVLSMTYCTDPRNSAVREIARRVKDTAYFGPRVLWS
ncbi:MAG TPA: 2OG-Fe(II) oxygenase [Rhizomicrobium sp.]|nr:2OG-Fe(II) oxygenase [Rhizomicrobium sp.]